jgi:hypothetical protein
MLEDHAVAGRLAGSSAPLPAPGIRVSSAGELPVPDPNVADSARLRLAAYRLMTAGEPAAQSPDGAGDDLRAVEAVIGSARAPAAHAPDALDVGAALVVVRELRLHLDGLEADLLDAAQALGLSWDVIAAIMGIPADEAQQRHRALRTRESPQ